MPILLGSRPSSIRSVSPVLGSRGAKMRMCLGGSWSPGSPRSSLYFAPKWVSPPRTVVLRLWLEPSASPLLLRSWKVRSAILCLVPHPSVSLGALTSTSGQLSRPGPPTQLSPAQSDAWAKPAAPSGAFPSWLPPCIPQPLYLPAPLSGPVLLLGPFPEA